MAATLSSPQITSAISAAVANAAAGSHTSTANVNHSTTFAPTVGSGTGNVNKIYDADFTIADSSTPTSIDLTSVTDPHGNSISFSVVNAIKITNSSVTASQDMTPFGGSNGLFSTGTVIIPAGTTPGSQTYDFGTTGVVVDSTHKIIKLVVAAGTNVAGKITVIGK